MTSAAGRWLVGWDAFGTLDQFRPRLMRGVWQHLDQQGFTQVIASSEKNPDVVRAYLVKVGYDVGHLPTIVCPVDKQKATGPSSLAFDAVPTQYGVSVHNTILVDDSSHTAALMRQFRRHVIHVTHESDVGEIVGKIEKIRDDARGRLHQSPPVAEARKHDQI